MSASIGCFCWGSTPRPLAACRALRATLLITERRRPPERASTRETPVGQRCASSSARCRRDPRGSEVRELVGASAGETPVGQDSREHIGASARETPVGQRCASSSARCMRDPRGSEVRELVGALHARPPWVRGARARRRIGASARETPVGQRCASSSVRLRARPPWAEDSREHIGASADETPVGQDSREHIGTSAGETPVGSGFA